MGDTHRLISVFRLSAFSVAFSVTHTVDCFAPGREGSGPEQLTPIGNTLYFSAGNSSVGLELWKTDGTESGTTIVHDIKPGSESGNPLYLTNLQGTLYFRGSNALTTDLWKSDGTAAGTTVVKPNLTFRGPIVNLHGEIYFGAGRIVGDFGIAENGLWKSDGSELGTVLVREFPDAFFLGLVRVGEMLFLSPIDSTHGQELWVSNGTALGTEMYEFIDGVDGGIPGPFVEADGRVFFPATNLQQGREMWFLNVDSKKDDLNNDGLIDVQDLNLLCAAISENTIDRASIEAFWSRENTGPGDANFDHRFDSGDLGEVFKRGKYDSMAPASWSDGDWDCDGRFGSSDLVAAFQRGWFESDPRNANGHLDEFE